MLLFYKYFGNRFIFIYVVVLEKKKKFILFIIFCTPPPNKFCFRTRHTSNFSSTLVDKKNALQKRERREKEITRQIGASYRFVFICNVPALPSFVLKIYNPLLYYLLQLYATEYEESTCVLYSYGRFCV